MAKMLGLRELERDLLAYCDKRTIHRRLVEKHLKGIILAIITTASMGNGPGGQRYPDYSPEYAKKKRKHGSVLGRWLIGIGDQGKPSGMLAEDRFSGEVQADGAGYVVWTAADEQMGIYALVHQKGLPLGRGGPSKERKWMHLEDPLAEKAVTMAYEQTLDELAAQFIAGQTPR